MTYQIVPEDARIEPIVEYPTVGDAIALAQAIGAFKTPEMEKAFAQLIAAMANPTFIVREPESVAACPAR